VRALHAVGKLHRDLKPSNVLCTPEGRVIVLDFGVATQFSQHADRQRPDEEPQLVGTANYMAPEQALGEALTPASDWYSVGVMLYEALVGAPPFEGEAMTVLATKATTDASPPSERVRGVPPDLDELCHALLEREPERRLDADEIQLRLEAARAVHQAISVRPAAHPTSETMLVGRSPHRRALRDAFAVTRSGRSVTVRVGGTAGTGKSSVVQHFVDDLIDRDEAVVLQGRAYEREALPYKAVDGVIDGLSWHLMRLSEQNEIPDLPLDTSALARLFPVLRRVPSIGRLVEEPVTDPMSVRRRAFSALRELLGALAGRRPLVLYVDDAQWGDTDSVALLLELVRPPAAPALLLVMTYREEEAKAPFLADLARRWPDGAEIRELTVGPLDDADAAELARSLLGPENGDETGEAVARASGGNPFLIEELARSVNGRGRLRGASAPAPKGEGISLDQMVAERVATLPEKARRVLEIVAVGGRPLPVSTVADAAGVGEEADELIGLLCAKRFVRCGMRDSQEVVEAIHDRIRETIVAGASALSVREHHRSLAHALEAIADTHVEALAVHWLGTGDMERAAEYAQRAAEQAIAKVAFDEASRLLRLALDAIPRERPDALRARRRLAEVLAFAGRGAEAAPIYLEAAREAPPLERIDLQRSAAEQLMASGQVDQAEGVFREVLASVGIRVPRSPLAIRVWLFLYGLWARVVGLEFKHRSPDEVRLGDRVRIDALYAIALGFSVVHPFLSRCMKQRHLVEALRRGDDVHISRAAALCAVNGKPKEKRLRALTELAERLATKSGNAGALAYTHGTRGVNLYLAGQWKKALEELDGAYAKLPVYMAGWQSNANLFAVACLCLTGNLSEARRRLDRLLEDAEQRGDFYTSVNLRVGHTVLVWLANDDPDAARSRAREAAARWSRRSYLLQHWYLMVAEVNTELYVGDGARGYERMTRDARALKMSMLLGLQTVRAMTYYIRGCCALASLDGAAGTARLAEARRMATLLEREGMPWTAPLAAIVGASVANAEGDRARSIELLQIAVQSGESADMPLHAGAARHRLGIVLSGEEGQRRLHEATEAMKSHGVRDPARFARMLVPGRWGNGAEPAP
jgi:tetratricopeptide (TPR) repeat protein